MRVGEEVMDVKTFSVLICNITSSFSQRAIEMQCVSLRKTKRSRSIKLFQFLFG